MRPFLAALILAGACGGSRPAAQEPDWDVDVPEAMQRRAAAKPAPAGPRTPPPARVRSPADRRIYRGARVDLDLKDADLHNVFRLLADVGGINIVVSDEVRGSITLKLRRVPWDQALDAIVRLEELELTRNGNLYLVMPR